MTEFTFLFRGRSFTASPAETQQTLERWVDWFKHLGEQGVLKDRGNPLAAEGVLVTGKQRIINDGPYVEAKDLVAGYIVVEARDLAHAVELSMGCPIMDGGGSVEVRPIMAMGG